jgi:tetratricopeptide (TPR) repeat protein
MEEAFRAIEYAPTYLPLHAYMGELLLKQDQLPDAITKFIVVALTYSARGEPRRAIDMYRRVTQLAPMDLNSRSRLIDQLIAIERIEDALAEYLEFAEVYYNQADLEMARKTYHDALKLAQQSGVATAWRVKIMHRIADIDLQSLDWRQAVRTYEQIRNLQPDDARARSSLIELYFRLGQETQAMLELDNYLAFLINAGRINDSIRFIENLVKEEPNRPHVRRRLAELYKRTGRTADAIAQLDAAGESLLDAGDKASAALVIESILAMHPENAEGYQNLLAQIKGG